MTLKTTCDPAQWQRWCEELGLDELYLSLHYVRLWAREESGEAVGVRFDSEHATVLYPFLKVGLDYLPDGEGYCDIRTPYDFGGPCVLGQQSAAVWRSFRHTLGEQFTKWGVVTEFARLHPFALNYVPEDATFHADNLCVDLNVGYDQIYDDYHTNQRQRIRWATENDVVVEIDAASGHKRRSTDFLRLYYETMEKVGAAPSYFFLPETLRTLIELPEVVLASALHEGAVISSGIFLTSGTNIFYFLSGSSREHLDLRPNNLMLDAIVKYGVEHDLNYFHLGGGSSGLRHFKSQIANTKVPYYLFKAIHLPEKYAALVSASDLGESKVFPEYRPAKFGKREVPPAWE